MYVLNVAWDIRILRSYLKWKCNGHPVFYVAILSPIGLTNKYFSSASFNV